MVEILDDINYGSKEVPHDGQNLNLLSFLNPQSGQNKNILDFWSSIFELLEDSFKFWA